MNQGKGLGFGLGKMKELTEAFKKAQQVQQDAKRLQEELEAMEIAGQDAEGIVTVVVSGNQEPRRVEISPAALGKDTEALSAIVFEAMQSAYAKSTETMRERMEQLTSGLNLPGL